MKKWKWNALWMLFLFIMILPTRALGAGSDLFDLRIGKVEAISTGIEQLRVKVQLDEYGYLDTEVRARWGEQEIILQRVEADQRYWTGVLSLRGTAPGTLELQVMASDPDGHQDQKTVSVPYKPAPYIHVSQPMQAGVYTPGAIPVSAEVYGEGAESSPLTVNLLEGGKLLARLGEGPGAVSLSLDASAHAGKALTLQFLSDNGQGQVLEMNRPLYIEDNPRLIPEETVDGEIVDADEQRLLWVDEQGRLLLKQRGIPGDTVVYADPELPTSDQHLVDGGVLFLAQSPAKPESRLLYVWRDGQLSNLVNGSLYSNARLWNVAGDWAAFTFDDGREEDPYTYSGAYNVRTGAYHYGPDFEVDSIAVGIDGTLAYATSWIEYMEHDDPLSGAAYIKEVGAEARQLAYNENYTTYGPPYFDGETLYFYEYGILEKDSASGQYKLSTTECYCSKDLRMLDQNKFRVYKIYSDLDSSTPEFSLILENKATQKKQFVAYPGRMERFELLTEEGELAYQADGRTFLKARSHKLPLSVSYLNGRMQQIGGTWYKTLGNTLYKVDINENTPTAPEWPDGAALTVTDIRDTSAKLHWQPIPGAAEYVIYAGAEIGRVDGSASEYTMTGLDSGESYDAVIVAVDKLGQRSIPLWDEFITLPTAAVMSMSWNADTLRAGSVLEWTILAEDARDVEEFGLWLQYDPQLLRLQEVTAHSDLDRLSSFTLSTSSPAPGRLDVKGMKKWGDPPGNKQLGFIVVKFEVLREGKADFTLLQRSYWKGSLWRDFFSLYANVTQSLGSETPPADSAPPVWPSAEALTVTDVTYHSALLQWQPAADNVGVAEYQLLRGDGSLAAAVTGGVYSHLVEGLDPSTSYTFRIEALDAAGNRSVSNPSVTLITMDAPIQDTTGPLWPQEAVLTVSGVTYHSVQLSWPAAQDPAGISSYRVYSSGQLLETVNGSVYGYSVDGLQPDTEYAFTITAVDAAGNVSMDGNPQITVRTLSENTAPASAQLSLNAKSGLLDVGSTLELHIAAEDAEDLYAFQLKLQYDPARFKLTNAVLGGSFGTEGRDAVLAKSFHTAGELKFTGSLFDGVPGRTGDIRLMSLKFTVLQQGTGEFVLGSASQVGDSDGVIRQLGVPVRLTVHAGGADLDGDGRVGLSDLVLISRHQGTSTGQPNFEPRFDFNRDGRIDAVDVQMIASKVTVEL